MHIFSGLTFYYWVEIFIYIHKAQVFGLCRPNLFFLSYFSLFVLQINTFVNVQKPNIFMSRERILYFHRESPFWLLKCKVLLNMFILWELPHLAHISSLMIWQPTVMNSCVTDTDNCWCVFLSTSLYLYFQISSFHPSHL